MSRKNYTKQQIINLRNKRGKLPGYVPFYSEGGDKELFLLGKSGEFIGSDHCRESICEIVCEGLFQDAPDAFYVGISVQLAPVSEVVTFDRHQNWTDIDRLRAEDHTEKLSKMKATDVAKVLRMSAKMSSLERQTKVTPHVLKCFDLEASAELFEIPNSPKPWTYTKKITGSILWALKIDRQWFNSPPVLSYYLMCMRSALNARYSVKKMQTDNTVFKLLKRRKAHEIFGRSRKKNWGSTEDDYGFVEFEATYGEHRFSKEVKEKKVLKLRDRFPNNRIFE